MKFSSPPSLNQVKKIIPTLDASKHKGQSGKIGIIGGCQEYTGAPYYASYSALKVGADLAHVFCTQGASIPIKSYSPELIVHPYLRENKNAVEEEADSIVEAVTSWFSKLHALVIGPGLGRDPLVMLTTKKLIQKAREGNLPMVIDGDAIGIVSEYPHLLKEYNRAVITPNPVEYKRLFKTTSLDPEKNTILDLCQELKVIICQKGPKDTICDGQTVIQCDTEGGLRRSGGQGDVLAGTLGVFLAWSNLTNSFEDSKSPFSAAMIASFGACHLVRSISRVAFNKHFRSTTTPDMIQEIGPLFESIWSCKL